MNKNQKDFIINNLMNFNKNNQMNFNDNSQKKKNSMNFIFINEFYLKRNLLFSSWLMLRRDQKSLQFYRVYCLQCGESLVLLGVFPIKSQELAFPPRLF